MAQQNVRWVEEAVEVSLESPFGTPGTYTRITHLSKTFDDKGRKIEQVPIKDASTEYYDQLISIDGLKSVTQFGFKLLAKAPGTLLDSAASGPALTTVGANPNALLLKAILGGESVAKGSVVLASPTPTTSSFSVTAATGAGMPAGQIIWVEIGTPGSGTLVPNVVATQTVDAITTVFAFASAPGTGAKVINTFSYYPDPFNTTSFSLRRGNAADANEQYEYLGCTGDIELTFNRGGLLEMSLKGRAANWRGPDPSVFGANVTYSADIHGNKGFALKDAYSLLQPVATTTMTNYNVRNVALAMQQGMTHTKVHGGLAGSGVDAVMRLGKREFASIKLTVPYDRQLQTWHHNKTPLRFFYAAPAGTGNTLRGAAMHMAKCWIAEEPVEMVDEDEQLMMEVELRSLIDPTLTTKLQKSPLTIALS